MECFAPLFVNVSQLSGPRPLDAMGERPHRCDALNYDPAA